MSTYVITGASGFVGNNLIRLLNTQEPDALIRALIQPGTHTTSLQGLPCSIFEGDITKPDTLINAFSIPEEQAADELGYTTRPLQEIIFDMMAWMELDGEL